MKNVYTVVFGKPEGKRPSGIIEETVCGVMDWTDLAGDRVQWHAFMKTDMKFRSV
jgi:hypothetical protein